mmetsp:Transcript_30607/g.30084  ORF Transcript_30607/g.30084 Transcript_30607/m.30084 type:complete len:338 (-) Transcript_30607:26-1039(-)
MQEGKLLFCDGVVHDGVLEVEVVAGHDHRGHHVLLQVQSHLHHPPHQLGPSVTLEQRLYPLEIVQALELDQGQVAGVGVLWERPEALVDGQLSVLLLPIRVLHGALVRAVVESAAFGALLHILPHAAFGLVEGAGPVLLALGLHRDRPVRPLLDLVLSVVGSDRLVLGSISSLGLEDGVGIVVVALLGGVRVGLVLEEEGEDLAEAPVALEEEMGRLHLLVLHRQEERQHHHVVELLLILPTLDLQLLKRSPHSGRGPLDSHPQIWTFHIRNVQRMVDGLPHFAGGVPSDHHGLLPVGAHALLLPFLAHHLTMKSFRFMLFLGTGGLGVAAAAIAAG